MHKGDIIAGTCGAMPLGEKYQNIEEKKAGTFMKETGRTWDLAHHGSHKDPCRQIKKIKGNLRGSRARYLKFCVRSDKPGVNSARNLPLCWQGALSTGLLTQKLINYDGLCCKTGFS
jgi:hypothetical protein